MTVGRLDQCCQLTTSGRDASEHTSSRTALTTQLAKMISALMIGAGEYTSGCVFTEAGAAPDKPAGVVAITFADLRRRGVIDGMVLCDVSGARVRAARETMARKIGAVYKDMDLTMTTLPDDDVDFDPDAFRAAIAHMKRGDVVTIFTPDDTHFKICMACVEAGLHVLCAKPIVKRLEDHTALAEAAKRHGVLVAVEYHKRFDPIYVDARDRVRAQLGPFSYFSSTMTQPKAQLDTFAGWAGKSSDISYYLNSHHMDVHAWSVGRTSRPERVVAMAARGAAERRLKPSDNRAIEDTITLMVHWRNDDDSAGVATYTASWIAPRADSHTQQHFHIMGHEGEIRVNQAKRGYEMSTDENGFAQLNPLYMKYTPSPSGHFAGQGGYGYRSIEEFVRAAEEVNSGRATIGDISGRDVLATVDTTARVTAMLEAGRMSLDAGGAGVRILYPDDLRDENAAPEKEAKRLKNGKAVDCEAEPVGLRLE